MSGQTLAEVLAAHDQSGNHCTCGEFVANGARLAVFFDRDVQASHRDHVTAAVTAWIGDRLAEARPCASDQVAEALLDARDGSDDVTGYREATDAALAVVSRALGVEVGPSCGSCCACDPPVTSLTGLPFSRMYVCATCGNKRCPAASDCRKWKCSGSNEPGQIAEAKS